MTKWAQVLRGVAYGDAIGYGNEFLNYETLTIARPRGPEPPAQFVISDDTQMTLYLAKALNGPAIGRQRRILDAFVDWYDDPDNNRAPGTTCLSSCRALAIGMNWPQATNVLTGDGCGAVMRVAPAAFLPERTWQGIAAWQAAATHGHPVAIASALVAASVIRHVIDGTAERPLLQEAIRATSDDYLILWGSDALVGHPLAKNNISEANALLRFGMALLSEALGYAANVLPKFRDNPWREDPSAQLPGWTSPDCLAAALLCVDMLPDDPVEALRRAAVTGGDSDSIAAVAGAILGALHDNPWPAEWADRLEPRYAKWISKAERYQFDKED